ncbi:nucleotidyltransferase family protein [Microvirga pudoricolor]|uniref:nucleotidyltransferase family protein n=1 Tax=Microvirga pudoricolor TaxID=2778729 RepID=UPI00194E3338|nr:nucleotidyltransferase family protein [Microvirga pudoricolor]MBM6594964.1 nucleotidyltransferase family protein [Microvirga pudoricolor]
MRTQAELAAFIQSQAYLMSLLARVEALFLPDAWIAAGILRNAVWDRLHGRTPAYDPNQDVDVVYFDRADASPERDRALEAELLTRHPGVRWSVKNQARMHVRNGDAPYQDTADAMRHWPETATAIGARAREARLELAMPWGWDDLFDLAVRPTPRFEQKPDIYRDRLKAKDWRTRWPKLTFHGI